MILEIPYRPVLINDPADFAKYIQGAGQESVLNIPGVVRVRLKNLVDKVRAVRASSPVKQKLTVTPANITFVAPAVKTDVYVKLEINSEGTSIEFENSYEDFSKEHHFPVSVVPADTAATFLKKLVQQVQREVFEDGFDLLTVVPTYATPGDATTAVTTVDFIGRDANSSFTLKFQDSDPVNGAPNPGAESAIITAFAPTKVANSKGHGTIDTLRMDFMENAATTNEEYGYQAWRKPIAGAKYSMLHIGERHEREDLSNNGAAGSEVRQSTGVVLYIIENAAGDILRGQILDWILTKTVPPVIEYTGTNGAPAVDRAAFQA